MSRESEIRGTGIIYIVFYYCFAQEDLKPKNLTDKDVYFCYQSKVSSCA